jgi:hypothetical protein
LKKLAETFLINLFSIIFKCSFYICFLFINYSNILFEYARFWDSNFKLQKKETMKKNDMEVKPNFFETFASSVTKATGSTAAFIIGLSLVIIWGATGPVFHFSETWQMIINT